MEDLIQLSSAKESYSNIRISAMEGILKVTIYTVFPDVIRFRYYPLVGLGIFYTAIKSQALNRCIAVK
jgi:hypothetical protein